MTKKDEWAIGELQRAAHRLIANMMRIMAGAGRVTDFKRQLDELNMLANQTGIERGWSFVDDAIVNSLDIKWPWCKPESEDDRVFNEEYHHKANIVKYALRLAAAKLEQDNSNASKNDGELDDCIQRYNEFRERTRRRLNEKAKSISIRANVR